jgi:hypothetical protein
VRRDIDRLRQAAAGVTSDLHRTLGGDWSCSVLDSYTLIVVGPGVHEEVALEQTVEDVDWYVRPDWSPEQQAEAFAADAEDAVANEVSEVFDQLGRPWPTCPQHGAVGNCDGAWYCPSSDHDMGVVGELRDAR